MVLSPLTLLIPKFLTANL
uniref:Uncharacterized protein n=1 Tax=Arundo donax TaxID=35708 RepID=A0A0A9AVU6_ARUDO